MSIHAKHCIIGYLKNGETNNSSSGSDSETKNNATKQITSGYSSNGSQISSSSSQGKSNEIWLRRAIPDAKIMVNNRLINERQIWTTLSNGDILSLGDSSFFTVSTIRVWVT